MTRGNGLEHRTSKSNHRGVAAVLMGCSALIWRKPALTHALGVLVLLKLLTPPIWRVPVAQWFSFQSESRMPESKMASLTRAESKSIVVTPALRDEEFVLIATPARSVASENLLPILPNVADPPPAHAKVLEQSVPPDWFGAWLKESLPLLGGMIWITGSLICGLVITVRIIRFQRLLRLADLAPPEQQSRAGALARRIRVIRAPAVYFVPGAVCPMLWAIGRCSRLLIPCELWNRLGERHRSSLLAHELAHLKRRDHNRNSERNNEDPASPKGVGR